MAEIRSLIHQEMRGVVEDASSAIDWRSYIRTRPLLAISLAFASGFLIVPRRLRPPAPVLLHSEGNLPNVPPEVKMQKSGSPPLMGWLLGVVGPIVLRAAQSYASSYVENLLANQQSGPRHQAGFPKGTSRATHSPEERRQAPSG